MATKPATPARITNAALAEMVLNLGASVTAIAQHVGLGTEQHATPAAVVDAVEETQPAPEAPVTASDHLLQFVTDKGLRFARGGRTYQDADALRAAVRVLRTGTPEVLPYTDEAGSLHKRGVSHLAIGRSDDGKSVFTQFCFTPESGE